MLADMPETDNLRHIRLTHPAISGQLHREEIPEYLSDQFEEMLREFI
ncbi:MAG: hypothetical protein ACI4D3_13730 [Lachnospiraceae bacterium]